MTDSLHSNTSLGIVQLRVKDHERSITFYEKVLGLKATRHADGDVLLSAGDGGEPLIKLKEVPGASPFPQRGYAGLYHYALLLPDRKSLGLVLRHLIQLQIPLGSADHLVSEALYINDPDGHGIEIYADRPRSEWTVFEDGQVHMTTDPLDGQGILNEAEGLEWKGMPKGTTMGHVHLHVGNLQKAKDYYCEVLRFDVMTSMGGSALFVAAGGYHHHLGLNIWAGQEITVAPNDMAALDYFTIRIPNSSDMDALLDRLDRAGYEVNKQADGSWQTVDPFGITIRLEIGSGS